MLRFKALVVANSEPGCGSPSFGRSPAIELVSVANKPILFHALDMLRDAEIRELALVVHPRTGEEIREAIGDGSAWGMRVAYVPRYPLGLVDALQATQSFLGDSPFVAYPGNGILITPLKPLLARFFRAHLEALLPLGSVETAVGYCAGGRRGNGGYCAGGGQPEVVGHDGERALSEDGVCIFGPCVHLAARSALPSWRGHPELKDVVCTLLDGDKRVEEREMEGWWPSRGDSTELLEGNRRLLDRLRNRRENAFVENSTIEGRVAISSSARVESTTIRGPAIIGPRARLADAYIGPYTSVGVGAVIRGAEVEGSIVMADAVV